MALIEEPFIIASNNHSAISFKTSQFQIIFLYLSSNYEKEKVFNLLSKWINVNVPTAVMGDMNENILSKSKLETFMMSKGFTQLIQESTYIQGSIIDHIYINQAMKEKNVLTKIDSCYYSDHDVISLYIKK